MPPSIFRWKFGPVARHGGCEDDNYEQDQGGPAGRRTGRRRDGADHVEQADLAVSRSRPEILRSRDGEPRRLTSVRQNGP